MTELTVKIHEIATDGLPDMDALAGGVAFVFDGCIVSGWPLIPEHLDEPDADVVYHHSQGDTLWEANSDVGRNVKFANVTHWVEFPVPLHRIADHLKGLD